MWIVSVKWKIGDAHDSRAAKKVVSVGRLTVFASAACKLFPMNVLRTISKVEKKAVDTISGKRGRGRPRECQYSVIWGRAENYRAAFTLLWQKLSGPLLVARNEDEVTEAFRSYYGEPQAQEFVPRLSGDILKVMRERKFPKRAKAQIKFLANSLAGRPNVEARTSRDICALGLAEERAKSPHKILRKEFYVECSCGFKGPALNNACRKCGAEISLLPELIEGFLV